MLLYEVSVTPEPHLRPSFERYMRGTHIAAVLATGCFVRAHFAVMTEGWKYRTTYVAAAREDLDRYLARHAQRLRDDFGAHFPAGVAVSREVWEVVEEWSA